MPLTLRIVLFLFFALCVAASSGCGSDAHDGVRGGAPLPGGEVNVYTARHYDSDDAVYARFTADTGIRVNLLEAGADELIARIEREGHLSPADVLIVVDAARLHRAEQKDLFSPVVSGTLTARIPEERRHPDGLWFGLTERARVIVAHKERVPEGAVTRYEDLADPVWRDRVLTRSSSHVYNQSLVASIIAAEGSDAAEDWCRGLVQNLARPPQGGDRDQVRAIHAGEGDLAIVNHYYLAQMLAQSDNADRAAAEAVRVIFPNQGDRGTHVNICGAGVVRGAPNMDNAVRLLEFLASEDAQTALAAGNFEYPVSRDAETAEVIRSFGPFRADNLVVSELGDHNAEAVRVMDNAGWR